VISPGSILGVLGNGQLGRMFALAAARLGYRVWCYGPEADSPAGLVCAREFVAPYEDLDQVREFARQVSAVTLEFENIPVETARAVAELTPLRPGELSLYIAQHRRREKEFLNSHGIPVAPFRVVQSLEQLTAAVQELGCPCVLKSAGFGYDGKGQARITAPEQIPTAWQTVNVSECVLEGWIDFTREISVLVARDEGRNTVTWDPFENRHANGILDLSICPATISTELQQQARQLAVRVAEALDLVGLLCVEMFVTRDNQLIVNEMAPRPHNSGHLTIEGCVTSQFEQQARITAGLPLGATALRQPTAMVNLLGERWEGGEPNWSAALAMPGVSLHLYGKEEPRRGRKMGHLTALGSTAAEAAELALAARVSCTERS
jgi:5-(carboxyamino)imidazole ribonucleotide synthase